MPDPVSISLTSRKLLGPVRRALGDAGAEIVAWRAQPIGYEMLNPTAGGLHRVSGTARLGGATAPWSVVLKVVRPWTADQIGMLTALWSLSPAERRAFDRAFRWNREALFYRSGLLAELDGGLRAPRCLGVVRRPGEPLWLWLEDVRADPNPWTMARYGVAARHLGAWQGTYLTGRPLPSRRWLSPGNLRLYASCFSRPTMRAIERSETWREPLVRGAISTATVDRLVRLWSRRDTLLDAVERLPRTFCHFDAFLPNLLSRTRPDGCVETVALDWAFGGIGAVGEDAGHLVAATLLWGEVPTSQARDLAEAVIAGYVEGLREAGWQGDTRHGRFGVVASAALRWALLAPRLYVAPPPVFDFGPELHGRTIAETIEHRAAVTNFLLDLADEAYALAAEL